MKCPHCLISFHEKLETDELGRDKDGIWKIRSCKCPDCGRLILYLRKERSIPIEFGGGTVVESEELVRPRGINRPPLSEDIPNEYRDEYNEACLVLPYSSKASAALSRRCLQRLLREVSNVNPENLADEIQQVIKTGKLPSYLIEVIDAVRNIGNFAAHPLKSQKTGEIMSVEPGEAEWNLDVLESLFDFYFVQPEIIKRKRTSLNEKLKDAGKKEMK